MYSAEQLARAIKNPRDAILEINRIYFGLKHTNGYNQQGMCIFDRSWDNMIILDACRYDLFKNRNTLSGELSSVVSRGTHSTEFLIGNFKNRDLTDTIYATANPMYYENKNEIDADIFKVVNIWDGEGWDDELGTVHPETLTRRAMRISDEYPNKKLIVHYMQPHYPFIGAASQDSWATNLPLSVGLHAVRRGQVDVSDAEVWENYASTLDFVLPYVSDLVDKLSGKTVVTADHGNLMGERIKPIPLKEYGHPSQIYVDELIKVPWLECPKGEDKKIIKAESKEHDEIPQQKVNNRLRQLGYKA